LIPSQEQASHLWQTVLENRTVTHVTELSREIAPGEKITWDNTFTPIFDTDDPEKIRFVLVSAVDITEQVRVQKELEKLGNLKDEFLSLASHELRGPLTAIQGNTQLLQRDIQKNKKGLDGDIEQEKRIKRKEVLLDKIVTQTRRLNELITEMLDTARIRGQVFEMKRKKDVNIVELVRRTIAQYSQSDQQSNIILQCEEDTIAGMWDESRIEQVLHNLITNALKYSPVDKPIVVEVKRQSADSENEVTVSVRDQGPGIPEKDQPSIFDRFYRVRHTDQEKEEGLGLGLYISHEIVVRHRGRLWVSSSPEQGTTFYFTLPLYS
jgi:signal transduction histidine kinase